MSSTTKAAPKPSREHRATHTKDGLPRKGKATHTKARLLWSIYFWRNLRRRLRNHLNTTPKGEASNISRALGISPSQVHRWSCPVCEHDQEPSFSIGSALLLYLESYLQRPRIHTITFTQNHPSIQIHRKRKYNKTKK